MKPTHLRAEFWAVEVPEDVHHFGIFNGNVFHYCEAGMSVSTKKTRINLPEGSWQIICTTKDCTEEQACEIVERDGDGFKDYDENNFHHDIPFSFARQSLQSMLVTKGLNGQNYIILKKQ